MTLRTGKPCQAWRGGLAKAHTAWRHGPAHGPLRTSRRQHVLDEHEDGLLRADLYPLADDIHELAHSQVCGHQIPAHGAATALRICAQRHYGGSERAWAVSR